MTVRRSAFYLVGGALLVSWLAAANMPGSDTPAPRARAQAADPAGPAAVAAEVQAQAARLRERMSQAPVPQQDVRNPFAFGSTPRPRPAAAVIAPAAPVDAAPAVPPPPPLTLMGIAEETTAQGPRRTAVIGGDGDTLFMVTEGQPVGARYKVTKIGADAVELEDVVTGAYRRLALR